MLPGDFGWDDVGTWAALGRVRTRDAQGNAASGSVFAHDAARNGSRIVEWWHPFIVAWAKPVSETDGRVALSLPR